MLPRAGHVRVDPKCVTSVYGIKFTEMRDGLSIEPVRVRRPCGAILVLTRNYRPTVRNTAEIVLLPVLRMFDGGFSGIRSLSGSSVAGAIIYRSIMR